MENTYRERTSLARGARDIAKEAKRNAVKKVNKAMDRASDEYSGRTYHRFENDDEDEGGDDDQYYYQDGQAQNQEDDEGSSDATEGHDDEDEIYEGEYQGVPGTGDGQVALGRPMADGTKDRKELEKEREAEEEELAQQYELIIQECGHGRFQWQLFFVLGLALMSDGVEVFVVGFVLPSAETDMCVPNSGAGWLGEWEIMNTILTTHVWSLKHNKSCAKPVCSQSVENRSCLCSGLLQFSKSFSLESHLTY